MKENKFNKVLFVTKKHQKMITNNISIKEAFNLEDLLSIRV